ncbi:MAG: serine/threonine protein kinase [Planctomycetes bacterium]|nr:serine/threonine protein kinase [Planctomycetota bacterium]
MTAPQRQPDHDQDGRLQRLAAAMEAFLEFRAQGVGGDRAAFLAAHEPLRDLLEPMLDDAADDEASAPFLPQPGQCLGDYRLLREVGRGGMGVVYEAEQVSLRRRVALKVLPTHLASSPRAIERFRHEATLASRLQHPAIVPIHEVGEWRGVHFFSMEFVDGRPLHVVMQEERLGVRADCSRVAECAELVAQVAAALQHAHERGLVHRDVKPHNVMIGADGSVRLMDFGVAKELDAATRSAAGEFLGTPHYCSPEQVTGAPVGPTADVFALGIVLYELLAHRRPFDGDDSRAVLRRIELGEFPSLRSVAPHVPRDLQTICHKALERHPGHRYPSAGALAADLRRFLRIEPIHAAPPSLFTRSAKWVRRHRLRLAVTTLALVTVVGAPSALAWHLHRTRAAVESERAVLDQAEELAFRGIEQTLSLLGQQLDRQPGPGNQYEPQLAAVADLCSQFLALRSELPQRRLRIAKSLEIVAGIYVAMERYERASEVNVRARMLLLATSTDVESQPEAAMLAARLSHRDLQVQLRRDHQLADLTFGALDAQWQRLVDAAPTAKEPRLGHATTLLLFGSTLADWIDRRAMAETLLVRAATILRGPELAGDPVAAVLAVRTDVALGRARLLLGRTDEAHALLAATLPRFDQLPADPVIGIDKADALVAIGMALQRLGRQDEAESMFGLAMQTASHWFAIYPGSLLLRRTLLSGHVALGVQSFARGDDTAAERHLRAGLALCPPEGGDPRSKHEPRLADCSLAAELTLLLADVLTVQHPDHSHDAEARTLLQRAIAWRTSLLEAQTEATAPHVDLAVAHNSAALFANERGEYTAAAEHAQQACQHQQAALAREPGDPRLLVLLGHHQANLAFALAHLDRSAESLAAARDATKNASGKVAALRMAAAAAAYLSAPPSPAGASVAGEPATGRDDEGARIAAAALEAILAVNKKEARRLLDDERFAGLSDHPDFRRLRQRAAERP